MSDTRFLLAKVSDSKTKLKEKDNSNIILTTRARLARNLCSYNFGCINDDQKKNDILNLVKDTASKIKGLKDYRFYTIKGLPKIQRKLLIEKHLMSPEMDQRIKGKGILIKFSPNGFKRTVSIMINEEDHLRIQCVASGLDIQGCYNEVIKVEKKLEKKLSFAFDKDLGYLTACPTNLGTGLRISVIAHLPGLVISSKIADFIKNINKIGCSVRGYFGENSEVIGNLFQISNNVTLGKSENEIVEEMQAICLNIIDEEENAKLKLKADHLVSVEDSVYRSYGMLKYAKMLSYEESLELLSMFKLGMDLNIIKNIKSFDFYELINQIGDSHIMLNLNKNGKATQDQLDLERANLIREKILKGTG